jgi:Ca-activated chloride channel family protein
VDFARPNYLYLLTLVPLAALWLAWTARRRRADMARLGTPALITALSASVSAARRRWKSVLWFIALLAVILALARPRWGTRVQVTVQQGVQVMVALDVSESMLAEDIKPNRLARARLTVEELLDRLGGNEVGLVPFAGAAFVQFPLTADFGTARSFLDAAGPQAISRPGTALEEALRVALSGFPAEIASHRVILLLTDGEGHEGDPLAAARAAAEAGVTVYAIGFGSPAGEPIPMRDANGALLGYKKDRQGETVLSRLDETTLQQIANETGGLYFRASASGDEIAAITNAIAALDTGQIESQFETHGVERFEWFAGLALLALTAEFLLGDRSRLTFHVSRLTPHASRFTFHASRLTLHASRPTFHSPSPWPCRPSSPLARRAWCGTITPVTNNSQKALMTRPSPRTARPR